MISTKAHDKEPMENKPKGIGIDRVQKKEEFKDIIEAFTCKLCSCLVINGFVDRSNCEKTFCSECLKEFWGGVDPGENPAPKKCPTGCESSKFRPISALEVQSLKILQISCRHSKHGCNVLLPYIAILDHEATCDFTPTKCRAYDRCSTILPKNSISKHESECLFMEESCSRCKQKVTKKDSLIHDCIPYLISLISSGNLAAPENEKREKQIQELTQAVRDLEAKLEKAEEKSQQCQKDLGAIKEELKQEREHNKIVKEKAKVDNQNSFNQIRAEFEKKLQLSKEEMKRLSESFQQKYPTCIYKGQPPIQLPSLYAVTCKKLLTGHTSNVTSIIQLKDGRLASVSNDKSIKLWNLQADICEKTIPTGHTGTIWNIVEINNGRIVSGSCDKFIKVWNVESGACELTLDNTSPVYAIEELYFGKIAAPSEDYKIRIWNLETKSIEATLVGHTHYAYNVCQLKDGRIASTSYDNTVRIWSMLTYACELVLNGHTNETWSLCQLDNGNLMSGSADGSIKIWDITNGNCLKTLNVHTNGRYIWKIIQLSKSQVLSISNDNSIKITNIETGACEKVLTHDEKYNYGLTVLQGGEIVAGLQSGKIAIIK